MGMMSALANPILYGYFNQVHFLVCKTELKIWVFHNLIEGGAKTFTWWDGEGVFWLRKILSFIMFELGRLSFVLMVL